VTGKIGGLNVGLRDDLRLKALTRMVIFLGPVAQLELEKLKRADHRASYAWLKGRADAAGVPPPGWIS
jgi:hypothetical protein